ncbi:MAG: ExeA family protein [Stenotrophomonas sp.]|uniref:ExeA family protein n=1 Tax=Stenotrophomonas sp. TaxID=69392 RepID=UPI003D6CB820
MTLRLKAILVVAGIKQGELADAVDLSRPALSGLLNHDHLPARYDRDVVTAAITKYLQDHRAPNAADWNKEEAPPCVNTAGLESPTENPAINEITDEDIQMLLRKHTLTPQARRHFGLNADPFAEPTSIDEVFLSSAIRYVRESMYQIAKNGGFMAVVGESGAGKTTLREELVDRIQRETAGITIIEPYMLSSEDSEQKGKQLRSQHVIEAIMANVDPMAKTKSSPEARSRQAHESLRQSSRSGHKHVLIIEEAHSLSMVMLKHLKRFMELKDGLRPLLSILLIGQPELLVKLSAQNPEIREVMQRLEIITLQPLDADLDAYLRARFGRVGQVFDKVVDAAAVDALRSKLTPAKAGAAGTMLYPLAVHNALAAAMNRAADLGVPTVTADVIRGV